MKGLSRSYWIPKMYKLSIGNRFVIVSKQCVIKHLSKNVTAAFRLLQKVMRKIYKKKKKQVLGSS